MKDAWEDSGGPAFPSAVDDKYYKGMSLRDYFAAKAMHAYIERAAFIVDRAQDAAKIAYAWADAMLAEREKE